MTARPHQHKCHHCDAVTECCGDVEQNYDGWPEWICREYDPSPSDFLCEQCTENERLGVCDDCGAWAGEPHDAQCSEVFGTDEPTPTPPAPTFRQYTFSVYVTVPEPVDEDDVDGYTRYDVEALVKHMLASYAAPFKGEPKAVMDWELMDDEAVTYAPAPATRAKLTRQEVLEGLADRGIDTHDDYQETK